MTNKTDIPTKNKTKRVEYRDRPTQFVEPNTAELKARNQRNIAIALALASFMAFVFITMITRGQ